MASAAARLITTKRSLLPFPVTRIVRSARSTSASRTPASSARRIPLAGKRGPQQFHDLVDFERRRTLFCNRRAGNGRGGIVLEDARDLEKAIERTDRRQLPADGSAVAAAPIE